MAYDYGWWPLVLVHIAVAVVFLGSFLRPTRRWEWRSFGATTAFVVALFAEMYGFPLTIYLLISVLGRAPFPDPFAHESGNLIASLLGLGSTGGFVFMGLGGVLLGVGMLIVAAGWRPIHAADGELVIDGPYAVVRHPQYAGLILGVIGALIQWPTLPTLVMAPVLVATYYRLARREERMLARSFGTAYAAYAQHVPMFLPRVVRHRARKPDRRSLEQTHPGRAGPHSPE